MQYQIKTPNHDYWWWSDGLYMVMPVMTKMYKHTRNKEYLDKLYEYITYSDSIMFDSNENLYYRDAKYVYPSHKSVNGKKDFWARGDGWVFAGLAKVLKDLPNDYKHRMFFVEKFQNMAKAIAVYQQPDGYWTRSMLDAEYAPGPETSGTAFLLMDFVGYQQWVFGRIHLFARCAKSMEIFIKKSFTEKRCSRVCATDRRESHSRTNY